MTPVVSEPLARCAPCLEGGEQVVDRHAVNSVEGFTVWECNRCGNRTPFENYSWCNTCEGWYRTVDAADHDH